MYEKKFADDLYVHINNNNKKTIYTEVHSVVF